jgi:hypothetical protein
MPPTKTLSSYTMRTILEYLDAAMVCTRRTDLPGFEGHGTWNIRMAHRMLIDAAVVDVAVEPAPAWTETLATLESLQAVIDHSRAMEVV